jgi:hypothetical protein
VNRARSRLVEILSIENANNSALIAKPVRFSRSSGPGKSVIAARALASALAHLNKPSQSAFQSKTRQR